MNRQMHFMALPEFLQGLAGEMGVRVIDLMEIFDLPRLSAKVSPQTCERPSPIAHIPGGWRAAE
jgi:hypothetical protein